MKHKKIILTSFAVISFLIQGCAFTPRDPVGYKQEVDEHILRVNRHGYIIPSDFASRPMFGRDSLDVLLEEKVIDIF